MTQQFTDITNFELLRAPQDGATIHQRILADLQAINAAKDVLISSQYSFTCDDIAQLMNEIALQNKGSKLLFDLSCVRDDRKDAACVAIAVQGLDASQWGIGCAPDGRDILHDKLYVGLTTGLVFVGSFNLTSAAERESNSALFITSISMAQFLAAQVIGNLNDVQQNQPPPPSLDAADQAEESPTVDAEALKETE